MKLTGESKLFAGILATTIALIGATAWVMTRPVPVVSIPKETLIPPDAHRKGNADAYLYLVEFSDFQCPACGAFAPTLKTLTERYKDNLLFVYRHFPLPSHRYARQAAYAAEAAGLQGKFWEAEEYLFSHQVQFSDTFWDTMAIELDLVPEVFKNDMTSDAVKKVVERDASSARLLNLSQTPSFFLNGVLVKNLYGPQDLVKAVETAIASK